jgi:hypothetical protein
MSFPSGLPPAPQVAGNRAGHSPQCREAGRSLVHYVPAPAGPGCDGWTRAAIAERIREITIERLCLDPAKYREDADFIRDLGMD